MSNPKKPDLDDDDAPQAYVRRGDDPLLDAALGVLSSGLKPGEDPFYRNISGDVRELTPASNPTDARPPDTAVAYVGPTPVPVTHDPTMEVKSVVIAARVDPRRAPTQRRLDAPPHAAGPGGNTFPAAQPLRGPGALIPPNPEPWQAGSVGSSLPAARSVGGQTVKVPTIGSGSPGAPLDLAKIKAELAADGTAGEARTVGGRTVKVSTIDPSPATPLDLAKIKAELAAHGSAGDPRTVGGQTRRMELATNAVVTPELEAQAGGPGAVAPEAATLLAPLPPDAEPAPESRWAADANKPEGLEKASLPSSYARTIGSDPPPPAPASAGPAKGKGALVIGLVAAVVLGVGAIALLTTGSGGAGTGAAAGETGAVSVPAPPISNTSVSKPAAAPTEETPSASSIASPPASGASTAPVIRPTAASATVKTSPAPTGKPVAPAPKPSTDPGGLVF